MEDTAGARGKKWVGCWLLRGYSLGGLATEQVHITQNKHALSMERYTAAAAGPQPSLIWPDREGLS